MVRLAIWQIWFCKIRHIAFRNAVFCFVICRIWQRKNHVFTIQEKASRNSLNIKMLRQIHLYVLESSPLVLQKYSSLHFYTLQMKWEKSVNVAGMFE